MIGEVVRAVRIPVLGNGDVRTGEDALRMLETTGCARVMVGRAAQGNPWVFSQIRAALLGQAWEPPTPGERMRTAMRHLEMALALYGEKKGVLEMRKHVAWYITGIPGAARLREQGERTERPRGPSARCCGATPRRKVPDRDAEMSRPGLFHGARNPSRPARV